MSSLTDRDCVLEDLKIQIREFCEARDWDPFHSAKDLAIGAVTESSELLEHFRFQSPEQVEEILRQPEKRQAIGDEMADVLFFLLRLSQKYEIDLATAFARKMKRNSERYPVEEFRGRNHKSTY